MTEIRVMTAGDIDPVFEIVDLMNWGYFDYDIKRMIDSEPEGNFVALENDRIIGVNFCSRAGDFGFIGPVIVLPEFRAQKIGENLMSAIIEHLEKSGTTTIELDSVFPAAPLYRRLGFKDKYFSYRLRKLIEWPKQKIRKFDKSMTEDLIALNYKLTGLDRSMHLQKFCEEYADSIYVIKETRIKAFGLVRSRNGNVFWLGPLVAEDDETAVTLFDKICGEYSGKVVTLGVLESNRRFIRHLRAQDFIHTVPALRMYRGEKLRYESNMYAIISPEKG